MNEPSIDQLLLKVKNKFLLSNAAAGRAKQIMDGSLPYVGEFDPTNPISTALREIGEGKIRIKALKEPLLIKLEKKDEKPSLIERLEKKAHKKVKQRKK